MKMKDAGFLLYLLLLLVAILSMSSCSDPEEVSADNDNETVENTDQEGVEFLDISSVFGDRLSLENPLNYANQGVPNYIEEDNTEGNDIQDEIATLGRVLFYDKNLSVDNTIACASCHQQSLAFGDDAQVSTGVAGVTGRHSMRLVNARFSEEENFFWDERANSLEEQTTMPIQDHIEMGFSGEEGDLDIDDLIGKLETLDYMVELFTYAFGDADITETRIQLALAQFVRSIQSFDSRYDEGIQAAGDEDEDFSNFTAMENLGKALFMGRAGCNRCHQAPEFSIDDNSDNNGVISVANDPDGVDTEVTRAPTLRDIFDTNGNLNGPLMHDGSFVNMEQVLAHYNDIEVSEENNNLDRRLDGGGRGRDNDGDGQNLNLDDNEMAAIVAFIKTLSGSNMYTDERWSDPFDE